MVYSTTCEPPHAHYLIAERLRAVPVPPSQHRRAMRFILLELKGAGSVDANSVIDAVGREKISVATLTRARTLLRIRSQKQRSGWMWVRPPLVSARFCHLTSALRRPHSESCCGVAGDGGRKVSQSAMISWVVGRAGIQVFPKLRAFIESNLIISMIFWKLA